MFLRIAAIVLLLLLAVRLVVRLVLQMAAVVRRGADPLPQPGAPKRIKELVECPQCGTFFEPDRGLARRSGERVCSQACRDADAGAGADEGRRRGT